MFHSPRVRHPDHSKKIRRLGVHNPSPVRLCTKPRQPACLQLFTDIKEITVFIGSPARARVPARDKEITFCRAEHSQMASGGWEMKPNLGKSPFPSPASSFPAEGPLQRYKCSTPGWVSPPSSFCDPLNVFYTFPLHLVKASCSMTAGFPGKSHQFLS